MRIVFLTQFGPSFAGVYNHTMARLLEWEKQGTNVDMIVWGGQNLRRSTPLRRVCADILEVPDMVRRVSRLHPDAIVSRWLYPVPDLYRRLSRVAPVVLEIHGDPISQSRAGAMRLLADRPLRTAALHHVAGAYFINKTSAEDPIFARIRGPRPIVGNGAAISMRPQAPRHSSPVVGMAVGNLSPVHGLDRLAELAEATSHIVFEVAVPKDLASAVADILPALPNLTVRGTASPQEYQAVVRSWTAALGTLALERSAHLEASPLKVRDYISHGVPTILPYWDSDLSAAAISYDGGFSTTQSGVWCVKREPSAKGVHLDHDELLEFANSSQGRNVRLEIAASVDIGVLERKRLAAIADIAREHTSPCR